MRKNPKIGIFVVAYNATSTINTVLSRIKPETWKKISEVFIFDDSSDDDTAKTASSYSRKFKVKKIKIFRNQINLGYGGNQKRGYLYAIKHNFDIVVLLHGDGQYAPEVMDTVLSPLINGQADAVFGSRMLNNNPLKGGMPLYKYVGNKILTSFQNILMNKDMTEYHSGYRAYSVAALKQLPFLKNSNDFHFDNEIIIQLMYGNFQIKEVPIPTYYGGEICRVNGMSYAWNVCKTIVLYRLHCSGLAYLPQFDMKGGGKYRYKENKYSSHNIILDMIRDSGARKHWRVLDIGCGTGFLAGKIKDMGHSVYGIDAYDNKDAKRICDWFSVVDIEKNLGMKKKTQFDCIIMADVLEHTRNPEEVLLRVRKYLKQEGTLIVSTGNIANIYIRLNLLLGTFEYTERGILDITHYHLFTLKSFTKLLHDCGFNLSSQKFTPIPFELIFPNQQKLSTLLCDIYMIANWLMPKMFSFQFVLQASPNTQATELLRHQEISKKTFIPFKN